MTEADVASIVTADPVRARIVDAVAGLNLPECWIAGGFVRNAVWDARFGEGRQTPINDVDVVYFKPLGAYGMEEAKLLALISAQEPNPVWEEEDHMRAVLIDAVPGYEFEVKNQARMHISTARIAAHAPYASLADAVSGWVETATATGIRKREDGTYEVLAPFGLDDLAAGIVRPTSQEYTERAHTRAVEKGWFTLWPEVRFESYDALHTRRR